MSRIGEGAGKVPHISTNGGENKEAKEVHAVAAAVIKQSAEAAPSVLNQNIQPFNHKATKGLVGPDLGWVLPTSKSSNREDLKKRIKKNLDLDFAIQSKKEEVESAKAKFAKIDKEYNAAKQEQAQDPVKLRDLFRDRAIASENVDQAKFDYESVVKAKVKQTTDEVKKEELKRLSKTQTEELQNFEKTKNQKLTILEMKLEDEKEALKNEVERKYYKPASDVERQPTEDEVRRSNLIQSQLQEAIEDTEETLAFIENEWNAINSRYDSEVAKLNQELDALVRNPEGFL